jgi:tetratricopeptide (TPR) repeat protein
VKEKPVYADPNLRTVAGLLKKLREDHEKKMKDLQGALTYFNKAIVADPKFYMAYANKGVTNLSLNKKEDAEKDFNTAIQLNDKYAPAYSNLSAIYFQKKDFQQRPYSFQHLSFYLIRRLYGKTLKRESAKNPAKSTT